jgi:predicted lipid-binding transport protein (Tim44 family)
MRWLLEALKGFVLLIQDTAVVHPQAARGGYSIVMFLTIAVAGLMAINPAKYWWAPHVLIGTGVVILLLLVVGIIALGNEMAGGSGAMGGRTGVMLSELDAPPPEDPDKRRKQPVRRKGDAVPDWKVKPRAEAALALLDFLADADRAFDQPALLRWVEETAVRVREAIEAGDLGRVAGRLTAAGRRELQKAIDALAADRARQVFGKVTPVDVQLVLVDAPAVADRHAVTALVTLKSRDYLADAKTGKVRDGTRDEWVVTHEFWSFRRDGKRWRLDRVRPAADADELLDVLNELSADRYAEFQRVAPRAVLDHVTAVAS